MTFANEALTRQLDLVPMDILDTKITIIGAGAIGSWVTLSLAKMGFQDLTVYDFDKVDTVNLNSQFYPMGAVGKSKVNALADLVMGFTGTAISSLNKSYEIGMFPGVVIAAVDSMAVRQTIWANHAGKSPFTKAIIDPRMGAMSALLYSMDPMSPRDREVYPKSFYSDSEAVQEPCTAKAVIFTANLLAGLVCKAVVDRLTRPDYLRTAQWNIQENDFTATTCRPT